VKFEADGTIYSNQLFLFYVKLLAIIVIYTFLQCDSKIISVLFTVCTV